MPEFGLSLDVFIKASNQEEANKATERLINNMKSINAESGINIVEVQLEDGPDELVDE